MNKFFEKGKKLYWWLIGTFALLYLAVAFVSTLHAITFFQLANTLGLAILLGAAYEIGQAAVLFSILMSQNKNRILAWAMMFLLTALQVTANVYASFKFMVAPETATENWTFWQRAILFGVDADAETYKVIISWISGALLPLVALGMTALVADNIRLATGEIQPEVKKIEEEEDEDEGRLWGKKKKKVEDVIPKEQAEEIIENEVKKRIQDIKKEDDLLELEDEKPEIVDGLLHPEDAPATDLEKAQLPDSGEALEISSPVVSPEYPSMEEATKKFEESLTDTNPAVLDQSYSEADLNKKPVNKQAGWHFRKEYVDQEHNVFELGKFVGKDPSKTPTPPKPKKA